MFFSLLKQLKPPQSPSFADYQTTERLKKAAELLDIRLLDHLIIKKTGYYSLMDN
ncbi:JAB domain-containing protein [Mucilaginibacter sp. OAE612]|uniref:JAB domain-containing protein n=1 Tax=Mucilaginibacter sp. OAE612 TaxID=3156444 RepID=UPI0035A06EEC